MRFEIKRIFAILAIISCCQLNIAIGSDYVAKNDLASFWGGLSKERPAYASPTLACNKKTGVMYLSWVTLYERKPVILKWADNEWIEIVSPPNIPSSYPPESRIHSISLLPTSGKGLMLAEMICSSKLCSDCGRSHDKDWKTILVYQYTIKDKWKVQDNSVISAGENSEVRFPRLIHDNSGDAYLSYLHKSAIENEPEYQWRFKKLVENEWKETKWNVSVNDKSITKREKFYCEEMEATSTEEGIYAIWAPNPRRLVVARMNENQGYSYIHNGLLNLPKEHRLNVASPAIAYTSFGGLCAFWTVSSPSGDYLCGKRYQKGWENILKGNYILLQGKYSYANSKLRLVTTDDGEIHVAFADVDGCVYSFTVHGNQVSAAKRMLPTRCFADDFTVGYHLEYGHVIAWRVNSGNRGDILAARGNSDGLGNPGEWGRGSLFSPEPTRFLWSLFNRLIKQSEEKGFQATTTVVSRAPMKEPVTCDLKPTLMQMQELFRILRGSALRKEGWQVFNPPQRIEDLARGGLSEYNIRIKHDGNTVEIIGEGNLFDINIDGRSMSKGYHSPIFEVDFAEMHRLLEGVKREEKRESSENE